MRLLIIIALLSSINSLFAQQYDTLYFQEIGHGIRSSSRQNASFYQLLPLGSTDARNGKIAVFHPSGEQKGYLTYVNGAPNGEFRFFFKTGNIQWAGTMNDDMIVGLEKEWYANKQLKAERIYYPMNKEETRPRTYLRSYWDSLGNQTIENGNGIYETFYDDGKTDEKGSYSGGKKVGQWESYYDDGSLYYKEEYGGDEKLIKGTSFDKEGNSYTYTEIESTAEFPGGPKAWTRFLKRNLRYPGVAQSHEVEATLWLTFIVDKEGNISDAESVKELGYGFDHEGIRVLTKSPKWIPAKQRGQIVKSRMQIRLIFKMR